MNKPKSVCIITGSQSDLDTMQPAIEMLKSFKVGFEFKVLSAHRTPKELVRFVEKASIKGVKVFITAAGMSAALSGVVAAHTVLPVIGVPVESGRLKGLDALLSTVQMPPGVPVACMAIGRAGAKNASLLALAILALQDKKISSQLVSYRNQMRKKIKKIKVKV
ncbi:MAG: 5-(carboxyamino)imidazole ribonucleotide mutase [Candidatus Omnitrophica bacterium]|nr:5-(carboxyamino)imidazole ribonucleotide mutase [Candidatus Omnitrophota bacterium]